MLKSKQNHQNSFSVSPNHVYWFYGHKAEIRKTQFSADLAKAFEMGKMIAFSRFVV
jgi:hypothetical protein